MFHEFLLFWRIKNIFLLITFINFSSSLQIVHALDTDLNCKKINLSHKLETVAFTLSGEETSAC